MRVTLDVFSGRPNPTWRLTPAEARQLTERVAGEPVRPVTDHPASLGFRGFIVEADAEDAPWRAGLPPLFSVARPPVPTVAAAVAPAAKRAARAAVPAAEAARAGGAEAEAAGFLLHIAEQAVGTDALEAVHVSAESAAATAEAAAEAPSPRRRARMAAAPSEPVLAGPACDPFLTPIRAGFWNFPPILLHNNCYNYANNFASNTIAQPGRRAGRVYTAFECEAVLRAATADGCLTSCDGTVRVVALAIWPGFDFHWWRLHPGGTWAHKLGLTRVTNRDNLGRMLENGLTPETCDRGPYQTFCGFYYAPLGMSVL